MISASERVPKDKQKEQEEGRFKFIVAAQSFLSVNVV